MIEIKDPFNNSFIYKKIKDSRYKYKVIVMYEIQLNIIPEKNIEGSYFKLTTDGILSIKARYCWDGASGPTIDTKNVIRASCVHDVLYQMMREKQLSLEYKDIADRELQRIMMEDSDNNIFNKFRAWYYYWAVKNFGSSACRPSS